jgi:hypothetical protein
MAAATARPSPPARPGSPPGSELSSRPTAPPPSTTPRPGRPGPPGHPVLQSVRPTGRSSLSKRQANPYQTIADSAATRCQHHGGWAMSERYLRSGGSEFTPAEKPFVINPRSRADMVRPIRVPDRLVSLSSRHPGSGKRGEPIRIDGVPPGNGNHMRSREYTATEGFWPGHGRSNPGLAGKAALIRISLHFRLTRKGQSIMIRRQE